MRKNLRKWQRVCSIALAVVMLISPALTPIAIAQETKQQALSEGEADGKASTSSPAWIAIGFFTGGFSWLYPELFEISVPKSPLLGKSPDYVAVYSDAYLQARKKVIQKNSCIGGCISWGGYAACCLLSAAATPTGY